SLSVLPNALGCSREFNPQGDWWYCPYGQLRQGGRLRETWCMQNVQPRVAVVDDDMSVRKALARLLSASSFEIQTYGCARDLLHSLDHDPQPQCLILDLHMPQVSGLALQKYLTSRGIKIPTIIITAYNEPGVGERCRAA